MNKILLMNSIIKHWITETQSAYECTQDAFINEGGRIEAEHMEIIIAFQ